MNQERKVDSVYMTSGESGVVEQGRQRMANGIANHAVNLGLPVEQVGPVKTKHFVERNLPGSGGFANRRVGQFAAFAQRKKARGQPNVAHGHGHKVSGMMGKF